LDSGHVLGLAYFLTAAATDFIDGQIARRTDTITEFGKVVDPFADRLLVIAVLIALMVRNFIPLWLGLVIVSRDVLMVLGAPMVGINRQEVRDQLAVHWTGKLATALLFVAICTFILWNRVGEVNKIGFYLFLVGIVFSYISGYIYVHRGIKILSRIKREG
jgi:cardiolipin synthase